MQSRFVSVPFIKENLRHDTLAPIAELEAEPGRLAHHQPNPSGRLLWALCSQPKVPERSQFALPLWV